MYSKKDAKKIKSELKMLKNLAIEYLQSESTFKLDNQSKDKMSESYIEIKNIKNIENSANYKYINFILPLICYVESSSWILLGTPYIYNKRNEDHKIRNLNDYFQQSLFLSSLNQKNLKYHYKMYEESSTILLTPNSSATLSVTNTLNVIITNVFNILPKQANTCLMYVINQDHNTNVVYFDPPE